VVSATSLLTDASTDTLNGLLPLYLTLALILWRMPDEA